MATKIENADRLRRRLAGFPKAVRAELSKALEEGAKEMVDLARKLVPVDDGDLRDSIGWTWGDAPKGSISLGTVDGPRSMNLRITVYAGNDKAFYARWVEFGTKPHSTAAGGQDARMIAVASGQGKPHPGARAQPFFYPSYRALRRRIRSRVTRAINRAAKKAASIS